MIRLEKFERSDYDRFIDWVDSEESLIEFSGTIFSFPLTYEQVDKYIHGENRLIYKVIELATGDIIGNAELNNINYTHENARISRILIGDKEKRNKGFGKLIIKELIRIGFSELKLHRLDLGVIDFNERAIKCYKDCGFEIEGLLKDSMKVGKHYWSMYNMSILNNE